MATALLGAERTMFYPAAAMDDEVPLTIRGRSANMLVCICRAYFTDASEETDVVRAAIY